MSTERKKEQRWYQHPVAEVTFYSLLVGGFVFSLLTAIFGLG